MTRRNARLRGAASAAAIVAVAIGGFGMTGIASAKSKPGRYYGGSTSQENPLAFELTPNRKAIALAHVFVDGRCDDGDHLRYSDTVTFERGMGEYAEQREHALGGGRILRSGRFSSRGTWSTDVARITETFSGTIARSGRASGTFRTTVAFVDAAGATTARCDSGQIRWKARSARGRVYAGVSSTDHPVVVEVDRRGRSVQHLRFGWAAPCTPPESGSWLISEDFTNMPLSGGAFGLELPVDFALPDGGRRSGGYALTGRIGRGSATGTVSVRVTDSDAAGAPTSTCDSGKVSWTARSG
jgi:hypothetical protein